MRKVTALSCSCFSLKIVPEVVLALRSKMLEYARSDSKICFPFWINPKKSTELVGNPLTSKYLLRWTVFDWYVCVFGIQSYQSSVARWPWMSNEWNHLPNLKFFRYELIAISDILLESSGYPLLRDDAKKWLLELELIFFTGNFWELKTLCWNGSLL